ncbi:RGS domain-containing protein [Protomyces lactucae-debilis]|uniref:RGS domain-containing protein n=1 Tax=Protomyces lactucae-debilis TaxID=2754530 RepID=A0A1Y2F873_PROLT|nr:RGS domain-containing protein [Protomyces lactucae-debilis]ORY79556.1 RGS domain-containing protein [Protomyces lactucae-debilis]
MDKQRLPTLIEVLARRTQAPVDLYSFYIYMRDQQRSVDYLDCFLDISQHLALCRLYVRELRRSVLVATPDDLTHGMQDSGLPRSRSRLSGNELITEMGNFNEPEDPHVSPWLRSNSRQEEKRVRDGKQHEEAYDDLEDRRHDAMSDYSDTGYDYKQNRNSYLSDGNLAGESPNHTINRRDIRASAERILYAYLIQGSEREIALPPHITRGIATAIEVDGRDDPEVFDEARDYIFQAMEREAFPGFLRSKALGNLVPLSAVLRLLVGLLALLGGLWTGFSLVFLDFSRVTRVWVLLPFFVGTYCCLAYQYELDAILAMLGVSESTFCSFLRIKEPYVRSLLFKRALWVLFLALLLAGILTALFAAVPSIRL